MKNRPYSTWDFLKGVRVLTLGLCLVGVYGCSDKENKVSSNVGNDRFDSGRNMPNLNSTQTDQFQQILSSFNCRQGQRLDQIVTFHSQGSNQGGGSRTTIGGNFQPGPIGGEVSQLFVGVSAYNDVIIVSRVGSGSQVQGYNVTLSMCSYSGSNLPLIDNKRQLSNFQAPNGIVLDTDSHCNFGSVDSAKETTMQSAAISFQNQYGNTINLPAWTAYTTFYKPSCNGTY